MAQEYSTKEEILAKANTIVSKSLREVLPEKDIQDLANKIGEYGLRRKGLLGDIVEEYFFDIHPGNISAPDFVTAGVELKTTPIKKHHKNDYSSKERLVFSMIDYRSVIHEKWETSSFIKKNKRLLLMFYLWAKEENLLDYKFKFIHFLDLFDDISTEDIFQIKKDWEYIVEKVKRNEAHLLSEADTYYLGACTKAANSMVVREQPMSQIPAKPRAFCFKQQYINYLVQTKLLGKKVNVNSILSKKSQPLTIGEVVRDKFQPFVGKTDIEILKELGQTVNNKSKNYKRAIANRILGVDSNDIEELNKANITLRVITLEPGGALKESISFPAFDYKKLVNEIWYDEEKEVMADFHLQLETKKFLFVVFQKQGNSNEIVLKKTLFWNFPMEDIDKAKAVWKKTQDLLDEGKVIKEIVKQKDGKKKTITYFPGISFNGIAHVRPHGKNREDTKPLPTRDQMTGKKEHTKQCFWLNAKYIQRAIENTKDQY